MKYNYERIALWAIVIILVVAVFFQQRRSGFALQAGANSNTISLFDMMEYQSLPEFKRTMYKQMLTSNAATLSSITNGTQYKMKMEELMNNAFNSIPPSQGVVPPSQGVVPPSQGVVPAPSICRTGQYRSTSGICMACSLPGTNQYVMTPCGPNTNTVIGTVPPCTGGKTRRYYMAGSYNMAGSPGTCG